MCIRDRHKPSAAGRGASPTRPRPTASAGCNSRWTAGAAEPPEGGGRGRAAQPLSCREQQCDWRRAA
eukprot:7948671-Alexandrium_andersonii.AAC.1